MWKEGNGQTGLKALRSSFAKSFLGDEPQSRRLWISSVNEERVMFAHAPPLAILLLSVLKTFCFSSLPW